MCYRLHAHSEFMRFCHAKPVSYCYFQGFFNTVCASWKRRHSQCKRTWSQTKIITKISNFPKKIFFSSPEHNVLMVSFCDRLLSVVCRASSTFALWTLQRPHLLYDLHEIWSEDWSQWYLGGVWKWLRLLEKHGCQGAVHFSWYGYIWL
jgi:hypothetical protein